MHRRVVVHGRTVAQYAAHVGVDPSTVREWIEDDRLNVVDYVWGPGRGGHVVLVQDADKPERLVPVRRGGR